ncbi:esterase family protein [Tianweitania sp.]|uniref:esterase family protein n=1 Tax=Tianweitania sp. TaxID=2021634 RepID=UPI0028A22557|nr:alpha/beta hydrolase-fold protein [Tianweitania sp.]
MVRTLLSLALCLVASLSSAQDVSIIRAENGWQELTPGNETQLEAELDVRLGDYVVGAVEAGDGKATVDLLDGRGQHMRRLIDKAGGTKDFRFVAASDRPRVRVAAQAAVKLRITEIVPSSAQVLPAPEYLSPAISRFADDLAAGKDTTGFWNERLREGTPMVEPSENGQSIVTFLARGAERNVRLFGGPSGDHEELERLGQSDTWFKSFIIPNETRLSYQLAYDVPDLPGTPRERRVAILATAKADPFNKTPWPADAPDAFNQESILELGDAPLQPGLEETDAPKGTLSTFQFASKPLGNERAITIYRPAGFDPADPKVQLLFLFDADKYLTAVPTPRILDNLISAKIIPPTVAVFVSEIDSNTRARELPANDAFADFMAEELFPRVIAETGLKASAERTTLAGSSYGGLAAATIALRHSDIFGNAICLSGSFWWHPATAPQDQPNHVAHLIAAMPAKPVRFFLTAGLFETGRPGSAGILDTSRHLRDVLLAKDYAVTYREYAGGHDYVVWRGALADMLIAKAGRQFIRGR